MTFEEFNAFLERWEAFWLFALIGLELVAGTICAIYCYLSFQEEKKVTRWAEEEYKYDKAWNEKMLARETRRQARKKEQMQPLEKEMD